MLIPNIPQGFGLEIIMIAVTGYLWFQSLKNRKTASLGAFFALCSAFMLFLLVNIPVRLTDFCLVGWGQGPVFIVNALFIALETLTAFEWFLYFLTIRESELLNRKNSGLVLSIPFDLIVILLLASYKTGWLFYVDDQGMYQRGSLFFLQILIPYLYVVASLVSAIQDYRKSGNKRTFSVALSALGASAVASVLQIFFSGSFVLAGFCLAIIILYVEMFQYELKQIEKKKTLGAANRELETVNDKLDETIEELELKQTKLEESLTFTNYFLDTYVSAYYVDLNTLDCRIYKRTEALEEDYPVIDNYYDGVMDYINRDVHPDDRDALSALLAPDNLKAILKDSPAYSCFFKDISRGEEKYYKVQVIRGADKDHAAFGFLDQTTEMREQQKRLLGAIPLSSDVLTKANIGLWSFELDEGCAPRMYADEAMLGLIGLDHQIAPEETYHAWYDHIDAGSYELVNDAVSKMVSGEHAEVQYPWHHPNGETWIVRCGGVRNFEYTKGIRIEGTHQDVTRVLHLDEEMKRRERESLFNYFIDSYDSAYFVNLAENTFDILHMSDSLSAVFGKCGETYEDMIRFIDRHIHPDDRELMHQMIDVDYIRGRLKTENAISFTVREFFDGNEKTMRGQIIRGTDEDHVAVGFMDITEQAMEQQKRLLGAIPLSSDVLTKANIGLWSFELDEGCAPRMYADEAMLGLIGLEHQIPPEDTYHAWYDNIDAGSYNLVADAVDKMISGEHAEVQYPWHHPNGDIWIVRCGGVRNFEYTKGIRIEGIHQNVSELLHYDEEQRKREERQRQDELARVRAEASNKAKTEFLFNMSHDIRTPMNAILGYTDIAIKHGDDRARVDESLEKIQVAGGHLLNLINDILEMSRIESGKLEISEEPVDLRKLIDGVEQMSRSLAIEKSIDFQTDVSELRYPYVYSDELHANEVLINLISNAVKYTPVGGKVRFRVNQTDEAVNGTVVCRFEVEDNGIGMSEEFQQHLFEAFSREKSATVSKQEGAGLGLSIVKNIVDLAGGTIWAKSKLNEGSTFIVEVPLRVMDEDAIHRFEEENRPLDIQEEFSLNGKRVLLVEDNEMNRDIATDILEEAGLSVDTAEDGVFAVKAITENGVGYYDFVLMDIQMPVMNGFEATKAIRDLPNGDRVTIIALSANAFEEDIRKSLEAGMDAHVAKPIDVKQLFETMQGLSE